MECVLKLEEQLWKRKVRQSQSDAVELWRKEAHRRQEKALNKVKKSKRMSEQVRNERLQEIGQELENERNNREQLAVSTGLYPVLPNTSLQMETVPPKTQPTAPFSEDSFTTLLLDTRPPYDPPIVQAPPQQPLNTEQVQPRPGNNEGAEGLATGDTIPECPYDPAPSTTGEAGRITKILHDSWIEIKGLPAIGPILEAASEFLRTGEDSKAINRLTKSRLYAIKALHIAFPPAPHSSPAPNTTQEHTHHDLPPHEKAHRLALRNNTFIQMLHYTHQASNITDCWICGRLPPHQKEGGMPLFPFPFSYNGTCEAWFALITADRTTRTSCPDGNRSCKNRWPWGDLNKVLNAVCYPNEDGDPQATGTVLESEEYKQGNMSMSYRILNTKPKKNAGPPSISVSTVKGHLCVRKKGSVPLGHSDCHTTVSFEDYGKSSFLASRHTYFICGQTAYVQLPLNWGGTCYIAFLLPPVFVAPSTYHRDPLVPHVRHKRMSDISGIDHTETTLEQYTDFNKGFFFFIGPVQNSKLIRKLTRTLEVVVNQTASALGNLTQEQSAIRLVALQNRLVLDVILADRGGACKIIGSSCCIFIPDNSTSVYTAITKLHKIAASLHQEPARSQISGRAFSKLPECGSKLDAVILPEAQQ
ncbi:endogenous retrovirus group PABLB member 1 Env polyprotein-like [Lissotriton helveticus]